MTRNLKILIGLAAGLLAAGGAYAFSMWGPLETWQTQDLDYVNRYLPFLPLPDATIYEAEGPGSLAALNQELGGTKNMGEGSRQNTAIITYGYDSTFLTYFGAQGVKAVDSAFAVLNGLPTASGARLNTFATTGNQQVNYTAQALRMLDLKSTVLWLLIEHLGLIGETHTYDLRERVAVPSEPACDFYYVVLQRNFDPVTYDPSQYVNGTLLTYQIGDLCPGIAVGDAMEQTAQAGVAPFSSVATREALQVGGYYLRITRDDMGGLKYLYSKGRYVNESFDTNSTVTFTSQGYNPVSSTATNAAIPGATFTALLGGVEKVSFVKVAYDSYLGSTFDPITYHYTVPFVTNNTLKSLTVTRTITQPDIIFTAGDLTQAGPAPFQLTLQRTSGFITPAVPLPGSVNGSAVEVAPSVITPELIVTLNNSGQVYYNIGTGFNTQSTAAGLGFIWGSFDGSTNAPIAFPTGRSVGEIEAAVLNAGPELTNLGVYNPAINPSSTNSTTGGTGTGVATP